MSVHSGRPLFAPKKQSVSSVAATRPLVSSFFTPIFREASLV
ncbi:hypothetical protein U6B65_11070 [Oscillospiraceae bacterium MB08-C2-2]|nr:hypothetical protein U6B65_11070 [Oscillospiraceae bacterium MB08-C2-2]